MPIAHEQYHTLLALIDALRPRLGYLPFIIDAGSPDTVLYKLNSHRKINETNEELQEMVSALQQQMSKGWLRQGDVFIKWLPDNHLIINCYQQAAQLANIEGSHANNVYNFFRITTEEEFLKFQRVLLGREVNLLEQGLISSVSEGMHQKEKCEDACNSFSK